MEAYVTPTSGDGYSRLSGPPGFAASHLRRKRRCGKNHLRGGRRVALGGTSAAVIFFCTDLAQAGSRNHQLLLKLKQKGAVLMGTESAELLVEEYQLVKQVLAEEMSRGSARQAAQGKTMQDSLLKRRDQFIGRRISQTLLPGETGLLFVGMLHSVEPWLDKDIQVLRPVAPKGGERPS